MLSGFPMLERHDASLRPYGLMLRWCRVPHDLSVSVGLYEVGRRELIVEHSFGWGSTERDIGEWLRRNVRDYLSWK